MSNPRILSSLVLVLLLQSCAYYFGNKRIHKTLAAPLEPVIGRKMPSVQKTETDWKKHQIVKDWASKKLPENWKEKGKTDIPRIILAKLAMGIEVPECNAYLQSLKPWGKSGTDWFMNPNGDYDFSEIVLVNILFHFGKDSTLLYSETVKHLCDVMLTEHKARPFPKTPNSLCVLKETENHILMKESVRYLRRCWIYNDYSDPKMKKEIEFLEEWMSHHLKEMLQYGFWEYNSIPYLGYTVIPLLTLNNHAPSEEIRKLSQEILDRMNYIYVLGTLDFKRVVPFRRQLRRFGWNELSADPHTALMKTWYFEAKDSSVSSVLSQLSTHQSLIALMSDYRLPDTLVKMIDSPSTKPQFTKIGHGWQSSPEIHWKTDELLLTGGGLQRGKISQLVPRPIVLIQKGNSTKIEDCFHIKGHPKIGKINNTGIYKCFAVGLGNVNIPNNAVLLDLLDSWYLYKLTTDYNLAVYQGPDFGILYICSSSEMLADIIKNNPIKEKLSEKFVLSGGGIFEYDIHAPKNKWVIKSVSGVNTDRKIDYWPMIETQK